jgi:hypothetical protein
MSSPSSTPDLDSKSHTLPSYNEHILSNFPTYLDQQPPGYGEAIRLKKPSVKKTTRNDQNTNRNCQLPTLARLLTVAHGSDPTRNYAQQSSEQKRQIIEQRLKTNFPIGLTLVHLSFLVVVALCVIILQVILVVRKADYYYVFSGVWAGLTALALAVICLVLGNFKGFYFDFK